MCETPRPAEVSRGTQRPDFKTDGVVEGSWKGEDMVFFVEF